MNKINWFYVALIVIIPLLFWLLKSEDEDEIAFFGFVENLETEINYNYDIVVDKIFVSLGQKVTSGSPLMKISRRKSKEVLEDQSFQIQTLLAEEKAWKKKKLNELEKLTFIKEREVNNIQSKIIKLEKEQAFKKSLVSGKLSFADTSGNYNPMADQLEQLKKELDQISKQYDQESNSLNDEIAYGINPFRTKINELQAEKDFDATHKIQYIDVPAPSEGLIGNIYCKEAEHVPAFKTLLTFYEPHSGIIKGYVHEDLTMSVEIGDLFEVSSLKNEELKYEGKVIGLGSRIVEIPARLRKFPQIKTYGREITIAIPTDNIFLQKEKVVLKINQQSQNLNIK